MPFMTPEQIAGLEKELEGTRATVVHLGSGTYAKSIKRWSDTCEKEAGAIVYVTSTSEVSITIRFARKNHIEFVVAGCGHSTSGASATHGGIVIDMAKMRKVLTDPASMTVAVQAGATWDDVNESTSPWHLAVVGSTASQVGVASSTLGGGYGWLTGRYGLIIDNLKSVKIVLASGEIKHVSEEEDGGAGNKDLFWAIRGAGQAFGVATEFTFAAHRIPAKLFGGFLSFSGDKLARITDFANWFDEQQNPDSGFVFGFQATPDSRSPTVIATLFYNGTQEAAESVFHPILSLEPLIKETAMMSYTDLNRVSNIASPVLDSRKCSGGTNIHFPIDSRATSELWNQFTWIVAGHNENHSRMGRSVLAIEMIPFNKVIDVPIEATACANRGRFYNVGLLLCWHDPAHDSVMHLHRRSIISKIERWQADRHEGQQVDAYANYAGHEYGAKYLFGPNLPRLQEVKRKYDPANVFHKWHNLVSQTEVHPA
ncbi:hypothetical protein BJX64DRAFT_116564 [Aspergillus heterothallicus]